MMALLFRAALGAFGGASIFTKLIVIGSIVAALGVVYGAWHVHVYRKGYNAAIAAIARADARAVRAAEGARARLRECTGDGVHWDQSTGKCERR